MGHPYTNTLFDIYLKFKLTLAFCFYIVCILLNKSDNPIPGVWANFKV